MGTFVENIKISKINPPYDTVKKFQNCLKISFGFLLLRIIRLQSRTAWLNEGNIQGPSNVAKRESGMPRGRNIFPQSAKGAKLVSVGPGKSAANFRQI
jgi:hypothetical protein